MTFQIGLHIDDLGVLKFIQKNLGCGKISISGNRSNFFVNDRASLINIIIPVFKFIELKSSKYDQFLVFEKAVNFFTRARLERRSRAECLGVHQT